jgi:ABC-2 type transport system ATP-binding protein
MPALLEVKGLKAFYGQTQALYDVGFDIPEGGITTLLGANGAGKTTLIRTLMNIYRPSRGTATVMGIDSRRLGPDQLAQIGYVSENQELPARLTVGEFLAYLRPFYPTWDRALEKDFLDQLQLPPDRKIGHLSHGMRLKLALVGALCFRPKLLVLDEPFSGLDPLIRDEFMEGLLSQAESMTILISSHELHEIEGLASHVAFIDEGRLLFQETIDDLRHRVREIEVTLEGDARLPADLPESWLDLRTGGSVVRFIETQFSEAELQPRLSALFGPILRTEIHPVGLRAMFTATARRLRTGSH